MRKYQLIPTLGLLLVLLLAACSRQPASPPSALILGTAADHPPFSMPAPDGKTAQGFDLELGRAIAEKLGLALQVKILPADQLPAALESGRVDLVPAGRIPDENWSRLAELSSPYYKATQVALLQAGGLIPVSKEDLENYRVAVAAGTAGDRLATGLPYLAHVQRMASIPEALDAVMEGTVDILIVDEQIARFFMQQHPLLMSEDLGFDPREFRLAMKKGSPELAEKINAALADIVGSGFWERSLATWLAPAGKAD